MIVHMHHEGIYCYATDTRRLFRGVCILAAILDDEVSGGGGEGWVSAVVIEDPMSSSTRKLV
jgi:hypothetical protein